MRQLMMFLFAIFSLAACAGNSPQQAAVLTGMTPADASVQSAGDLPKLAGLTCVSRQYVTYNYTSPQKEGRLTFSFGDSGTTVDVSFHGIRDTADKAVPVTVVNHKVHFAANGGEYNLDVLGPGSKTDSTYRWTSSPYNSVYVVDPLRCGRKNVAARTP